MRAIFLLSIRHFFKGVFDVLRHFFKGVSVAKVEKFAKYCKSFAKKLFGAAIIRE